MENDTAQPNLQILDAVTIRCAIFLKSVNSITSNKTRTNFSESPLHLLTSVEAVVAAIIIAQNNKRKQSRNKRAAFVPEMLKNVVLHSVATALASIVLLQACTITQL